MIYEIRKGKNAPFELVSITSTKFGGDAVNFICGGTHTYCASIKAKLENAQ